MGKINHRLCENIFKLWNPRVVIIKLLITSRNYLCKNILTKMGTQLTKPYVQKKKIESEIMLFALHSPYLCYYTINLAVPTSSYSNKKLSIQYMPVTLWSVSNILCTLILLQTPKCRSYNPHGTDDIFE